MIIRFSVENFLSVRDEQTLSLVASNREKQHPENVQVVDIPGLKGIDLLKSVVIYGANASGKTNVIQAMDFMRSTVLKSFDLKPDAKFPLSPFRLDRSLEDTPSCFEMTFLLNGIRHEYFFSILRDRVTEEWLDSYPKRQRIRWFSRSWNGNGYDWEYSPKEKDLADLESKTRPNALTVSTATQFAHPMLTQVFRWFESIKFIEKGIFFDVTQNLIYEGKSTEIINQIIREADLGINSVQVSKQEKMQEEDMEEGRKKKDAFKQIEQALKILDETFEFQFVEMPLMTEFMHQDANTGEKIPFVIFRESEGTQRLYSLLGPWILALQNGQTVCIDEIDLSLHPLLSRRLIKMFHDSDWNSNGAQLIMTTHDTTLLDQDLFRRDQIWFTEKNQSGATELYPLTDYHPRTTEPIQKGYMSGRYGAIPILGSNFSFSPPNDKEEEE